MIRLFCLIFFYYSNLCFANSFHQSLLESEDRSTGVGTAKMMSKTKDALLSVEFIEDRTDYFVRKIKNKTVGEYSEELMYLVPFIAQQIMLNHNDFTFRYNYASQKASIDYGLKF